MTVWFLVTKRGDGAPGGIRTHDPLLRRQTLYPLSYRGTHEEEPVDTSLQLSYERLRTSVKATLQPTQFI